MTIPLSPPPATITIPALCAWLMLRGAPAWAALVAQGDPDSIRSAITLYKAVTL